MSEPERLDPALRAYVDAFIEETAVSEVSTGAALSELSAKVESATSAGSTSTRTGVGSVAKIAAAVAIAGVVGVLLWPGPDPAAPADRAEPGRSAGDEETPTPQPIERSSANAGDGHSAAAPSPPRTPQPPAPAKPMTSPEPEAETEKPEPSVRPSARRHPHPEPERSAFEPEVGQSNDLAAELELMRAARSALRSGSTDRALSLLHEHARTYPDSAFAEERKATEIMALCTRGDTAKAEAMAQRFRQAFPDSAFDAGLLEACDRP